MNKPVIGNDENCGCGTGTGLGVQQPSPDPRDGILVRHKPGTTTGNVIRLYEEGGVRIYQLEDQATVKPIVVFTNDQSAVKEVGFNVPTVNFSGNITQGTYPINARSIAPDPGGLNLAAPFAFQKFNVKLTVPGMAQLHTVSATDSEGNVTNVGSGVPFKHAFYMGYESLATLNQAQIKALVNKNLVDSLVAQWGGTKNYVVPGAPAGTKYLYWCGPVGTPLPVGATLNGLTLPLYFGHANVNVTNIYDGALIIPYWVVRTANRFDPGAYDIGLS